MYKLNNETWTELSETKGTFLNKDTSNGILLADSTTEPTSSDDAIILYPGEKRYLKASSGKIYGKTVRGEAKLATSGFSSSSGELSDQIQNLLRLGYSFGGNLSEQESVSTNTVYNGYDLEEDSSNHTYYLCNSDKTWTLGDDNPDSDFEEFTAKSISDKLENLSDYSFVTLPANAVEVDITSLFEEIRKKSNEGSVLIMSTLKDVSIATSAASLYLVTRNLANIFEVLEVRKGGSSLTPILKVDDIDETKLNAYQNYTADNNYTFRIIK